MAKSFLNLDDDHTAQASPTIGAGLKSKPKPERKKADKAAVAQAAKKNGFTRTTTAAPAIAPNRLGRPPMNEDMTYWRIYISQELRNELNQLRDLEGRRLNDLLQDMLAAYQSGKN